MPSSGSLELGRWLCCTAALTIRKPRVRDGVYGQGKVRVSVEIAYVGIWLALSAQ